MVCTGVRNFCSAKTCIVIIASCYYYDIYPQAHPDIWDVTQGWFSVLKFQNGSSWKSCQNLHVVWLYSLLVTKCTQKYQQHYCKSKTLWAIVHRVKQQPKPTGNTHTHTHTPHSPHKSGVEHKLACWRPLIAKGISREWLSILQHQVSFAWLYRYMHWVYKMSFSGWPQN